MTAFLQRLIAGAATAVTFHSLRFWRHWVTVWVVVALCFFTAYVLLKAPVEFTPATIVVSQGEPASQIAHELAEARVVRSSVPLWLILRASHGDRQIRTGTYRFNTPENVFSVARRLLTADYGLPSVTITFFEGITVREMAELVHEALPGISVQAFTKLAKPHEGYLFPDTYNFTATATAADIVEVLQDNFEERLDAYLAAESRDSFKDVVIMASILEKEARTDENRRLVAGVLTNRLAKGMPLQVDAVFGYIFNRDTYSPSPSDLKVDSPYNTYLYRGLPPGPINNPGLAALEAAANPTKTAYLYYLTGNDDQMHYATTYAGHQANLEKYLK